ncbi:MAG: NUDIX domain-containing protein [Bacteroidetes bacterium]|nr:NUDIX domain-containing protein [Bacteroidota bacterium]
MVQLRTAGLLAIQNGKLLLAFSSNKQCFYLPGGKINYGETPQEALIREIAEELNTTIEKEQLIYYTHISAPAYGETSGTIMEQDCFFSEIDFSPQASGEIDQLKYFSLSEYLKEGKKAPGAIIILEQLAAEGYID